MRRQSATCFSFSFFACSFSSFPPRLPGGNETRDGGRLADHTSDTDGAIGAIDKSGAERSVPRPGGPGALRGCREDARAAVLGALAAHRARLRPLLLLFFLRRVRGLHHQREAAGPALRPRAVRLRAAPGHRAALLLRRAPRRPARARERGARQPPHRRALLLPRAAHPSALRAVPPAGRPCPPRHLAAARLLHLRTAPLSRPPPPPPPFFLFLQPKVVKHVNLKPIS